MHANPKRIFFAYMFTMQQADGRTVRLPATRTGGRMNMPDIKTRPIKYRCYSKEPDKASKADIETSTMNAAQ